MVDEIQRVAELQQEYSSDNTPAMQERGQLIRSAIPAILREHSGRLSRSLGRFGDDLGIEGRDGIGRKTEAPWVRLYSESLSPSATMGFYVVIHFSVDGQSYFVTVGCSASKWDNERGDLIKYSDEELSAKVAWAKSILAAAGANTAGFPDTIDIGSSTPLPRSFEKATILAKRLDPHSTDLDTLLETIDDSLGLLAVIYEAYSQRADLSTSESNEIDVEAAANPLRRTSIQRQGYGLTATERRAIELRAMSVTREHLEGLGYAVSDESATKPFDLLAKLENAEFKIEVKGSTGEEVDSVLMTANEVDLHRRENGQTGLALVAGIVLTDRGDEPKCDGGTLELLLPWNIEEWTVTPRAYDVARPDA